jgi:DNA polymerase III sliding clamp (beta) subunit (PCNA family)
MALEREDLVAVLKKVAPALSGKELIPIFSCLCFGEKSVHAYDDVVAMQFPLQCGIRGGVRGSLLLGWLGQVAAKELEITQEGDNVIIKAGRAKLTTPIMGEDTFLFSPPDRSKATERELDEDFLGALTKVSVSIGRDPSHPWRLGVTIVFSETGTLFYASDNTTACRVKIGKPTEEGATIAVLPPRFVELLADVGKADPPTKLYLSKSWAEARFTSGLRLFSRTIATSDISTFRAIFEGVPKEMTEVPKSLKPALERAVVVAGFAKDPYTRLTIAADGDVSRMKMVTKSSAGNVVDAVALPTPHDEVTIEVVPEHLFRGLGNAETMVVLEDRAVLRGPGYTYLVSSVERNQGGGKEDKE